MHKPIANNSVAVEKKRIEEAIEEAKRLLKRLAAPARSWAIVSWNDPNPRHSPKDKFYSAVGFIHCLLDPDPKDKEARQAADNFLGKILLGQQTQPAHRCAVLRRVYAQMVREVVLPALRTGRPPTREKRKRGAAPKQQEKEPSGSHLLRDRWIAAVVDHIHEKFEFEYPTRNPSTEDGARACYIVAEALRKLKIKPSSASHVAAIWRRH